MRTSLYGQCWPCSNPADMCKSPRNAPYLTRQIFRRLYPTGQETTLANTWQVITRMKNGNNDLDLEVKINITQNPSLDHFYARVVQL